MSKINILGVEYTKIDTKEKMTVPDCFVVRSNKIGSAHGEAKFYIGNNSQELRNFFGEEGFKIKCFLLKEDLVKYLEECKSEYITPEQKYKQKNDFPTLWEERKEKVKTSPNILYFELTEQTQINGPRIYVNSKDNPYKLIRELSLPNITYLSAIKLKNTNGDIIFYFKLFIDYFGEQDHPSKIQEEEEKIEELTINETEKKQIIKARIGQGEYRRKLLEECPICPITTISDDRLLIASHIKPWVKSQNNEKTDPKNGFMFTPTFDLLFDRGYISFTDDKKIIISPWLSKMTCSKLNISPNKKYSLLPVEGREEYLDYHRNNILKK